jgi:hypothetical protein
MKEFTTIQQLAEAMMYCFMAVVVVLGLIGVVLSNQINELKELIKNKGNG